MTHSQELWRVIQKTLRRNRWTPLVELYVAVERDINLDREDFFPQAPGSPIPKWKRNVRNVLQQRKSRGDVDWDRDANYRLP